MRFASCPKRHGCLGRQVIFFSGLNLGKVPTPAVVFDKTLFKPGSGGISP